MALVTEHKIVADLVYGRSAFKKSHGRFFQPVPQTKRRKRQFHGLFELPLKRAFTHEAFHRSFLDCDKPVRRQYQLDCRLDDDMLPFRVWLDCTLPLDYFGLSFRVS
jgi:hypothetical protein